MLDASCTFDIHAVRVEIEENVEIRSSGGLSCEHCAKYKRVPFHAIMPTPKSHSRFRTNCSMF